MQPGSGGGGWGEEPYDIIGTGHDGVRWMSKYCDDVPREYMDNDHKKQLS